jgi:hypothetical protein
MAEQEGKAKFADWRDFSDRALWLEWAAGTRPLGNHLGFPRFCPELFSPQWGNCGLPKQNPNRELVYS